MSAKVDLRKLKQEIAEDEKVVKACPVLLSQLEIKAMLEKREKNRDGKGKP